MYIIQIYLVTRNVDVPILVYEGWEENYAAKKNALSKSLRWTNKSFLAYPSNCLAMSPLSFLNHMATYTCHSAVLTSLSSKDSSFPCTISLETCMKLFIL